VKAGHLVLCGALDPLEQSSEQEYHWQNAVTGECGEKATTLTADDAKMHPVGADRTVGALRVVALRVASRVSGTRVPRSPEWVITH
jgi:hypothetical protein